MDQKFLQLTVNFLVRAILGLGLIFLINGCIADSTSSWIVGLNLFTFLTAGVLGVPGVCVLYGIQFFHLL